MAKKKQGVVAEVTVHGVCFKVNEETVRMLAESNFDNLMTIRDMRDAMSAKRELVTAAEKHHSINKELLTPPVKEYGGGKGNYSYKEPAF